MKNYKITIPLIILLLVVGVSANPFPSPLTNPPSERIVPIHTGSDQTKDGSLSVNAFIARGMTRLLDRTYINNSNANNQRGYLRGSSVVGADNEGLVVLGVTFPGPDDTTETDDTIFDTSLIGTGRITTAQRFQARSLAHDEQIAKKRDLCADETGTIVFCTAVEQQVDVCSNIQGIQTNPPTGMVRSDTSCVWPNPVLVASSNATRLDTTTVSCSVTLAAPALRDTTVRMTIFGGTSRPPFGPQDCGLITIAAGQTQGSTTTTVRSDFVLAEGDECLVRASIDREVLTINTSNTSVRICPN